ncbi:MAG: glutamine synthetase, partial [Mycobacterium sp.]|nr:glutamine synthetase [Mycobacterium sp.]
MDTIHTTEQTHRDTAESLAREGVKYAMGAWIDIHGRPKS